MAVRTIKVIMNGVTGRMGYRQHLVRSILPIRDAGGVVVGDDRIQVQPVLVGRNADKLAKLAELHGVSEWTTDLDAALADPEATIYFDAQVTSERTGAILAAIEAGKHIFTEKPIAESVLDGQKLVSAAQQAGTITGVVHDKLYLPGLVKLKRLIDLGFFGRILSVRGEFGYWVFEGDVVPAQRPSWNYRAEDGGGMVLDMFCHWNYVLENLFGRVEAVMAKAVTHIPERWDEQGSSYAATADDAAYGIFELDGGIIAQINSVLGGPGGPRRAGRVPGRRHPRLRDGRALRLPDPATGTDAQAGLEPRPAHRPGLPVPVGGGARPRGVPERVPGPVGAVPARRRRRPPPWLRPRRRSPRPAAGGGRSAVVAGRPSRRDR